MFSQKSRSFFYGPWHSEGTANSNLEPGKLGKATFDGVYYSRVLLTNSRFSVPEGTSLKFMGMQNATTALVDVA